MSNAFTVLPFGPGAYVPMVGANYVSFLNGNSVPYILEWGSATVPASGSLTIPIIFPLAFPTALLSLQASATVNAAFGINLTTAIFNVTNAGCTLEVFNNSSYSLTAYNITVYYQAIGN